MKQHVVEKNKKSLSKIFVLFVAIVSFTAVFSGCTNTPLDKGNGGLPNIDSWAGWSKHNDNHGFSAYIPAGWSVDVDKSGLIRIGENPTEDAGDMVFMWTMKLNEQETEANLFNETVLLLQNFIPGLQVTSKRYVSNYSMYVGTMKYGEYMGVLMLSINGTDAYFTGLAAQEDEYNESLDKLIRVLYSFNYEPELMNPDTVGIVQMETWTDPKEGAFTIKIPSDWVVEEGSGLIRPYIDACYRVYAYSPDGTRGFLFESPYQYIFAEPTWVLEMSGFSEGSLYDLSGGLFRPMMVWHYLDASGYITEMLEPVFEQQGAVGQGVINRPDIVSSYIALPWVLSEVTAAEETFIDSSTIHVCVVSDQRQVSGGIGVWAVALAYYWAPDDDIELVEKIVSEMIDSFQLDPAWAAREQEEVLERLGIISETQDDIANTINSAFKTRSETLDRTSHKFSNAILGIEDVYDPDTGEHWTVPSGSSSYWRDVYGNVYGSGSYAPPTYNDNWKELICPNC
jgi:hypothetical protein